jgi:CDP-glycerol glycerophosphotransferase (TagB/SpsB family)
MKNRDTKQHKLPFPVIVNVFKCIKLKDSKIVIKALCLTKIVRLEEQDISKISLIVNDNSYDINFKLKKGIRFIKGYRINFYRIVFEQDDLLAMDIQNKIILNYDNLYFGRIIYNVFDFFKGRNRNSKIIKLNGTSIYLRQTVKNTMYLTVRDTNYFDYFKGKLKLRFGYLLSLITCKKDFILLYEKETSHYEESASVLYERLIDKGYNNVYFIVNRDNIKIQSLEEKYKKNLVYKNTLKHIIYFFKCQKFIGTESLAHSLQLRVADRKVIKKVNDKRIKYVFLQHGVMYMISLNSELRTGFRKSVYDFHKIVVSSKLEAQHFIDLGGFAKKDLYVCGLLTFDKAYRYDNADKIVIMPTLRRWEVNQSAVDYTQTKYFKMIERIVSAIPKNLRSKVIILPHPMMLNAIRSNKDFSSYIPSGEFSYDDILKECSLLITDYSSISYDAFYRGSNVIFYWEEKDECLKKYGKNTKLMLNKRNAFGDVVFNKEELKSVFNDNYMHDQKKKYINRYRKIVEFSDNKNAERLIRMLKKDNII